MGRLRPQGEGTPRVSGTSGQLGIGLLCPTQHSCLPCGGPLHSLGPRITLSKVKALFTSLENIAELGPERVCRLPSWASLMTQREKNPPAKQETQEMGFNPWVGKIPWRRKWQPTPVFLPGKSHGQRSLVGYHPWGHKESDMPEHANSHIHTGLLPRVEADERRAGGLGQGSFYRVPEPGPRPTPTPAFLLSSHGCHSS